MTEERKQELRQLLEEAMGSLEIRQEFGGRLSLPVDVYRRYLQECWRYFGLDCFHPFWIRPTLHVSREDTKSRLLNYINEELAPYIANDIISVASYLIESTATERPRVYPFDNPRVQLDIILRRLLEISLVRGIERALIVFDRFSRPEGVHGFLQDVSIVEGLKLKTDIEVFKGIRLVPLLGTGISAEVLRYFPGFPVYAFVDQTSNFFGQTLLVIDRPGFSVFHKPGRNQGFSRGLPVDNLPFQVGELEAKFRNLGEVNSFQESFSQALALTLNFPVQIPCGGFCMEESQTFNPRHGSITSLSRANRFRSSTAAEEIHIEKAKCLYERMVDLKSDDREKLQIALGRWIKSIGHGSYADKMIHVGIALERLYVIEPHKKGKQWQISNHGSAYLETASEPRHKLKEVFEAIYVLRSDVVHNREFGNAVQVGNGTVTVSDLVKIAQDRCRDSILKMLKEPKFPDKDYWDRLVLGG